MVRSITRSIANSVTRSIEVGGGGAPPEPSEFITNGDFVNGDDWTAGPGWSIAGGLASYTQGGGGSLVQDFGVLVAALIDGNDYVLTFDLDNVNNGLVTATLTGGAGSQVVYSSPSDGAGRTATFTATDARTTISFDSVSDESITVDNVSVSPA